MENSKMLNMLKDALDFAQLGVLPYDAPWEYGISNQPSTTASFFAYSEPREVNPFVPLRIVKNGIATIVFWQDGTKTVVKRGSDEPESDYAAFTAALGIKIFGSNSALKRIVSRTETQEKKRPKCESD